MDLFETLAQATNPNNSLKIKLDEEEILLVSHKLIAEFYRNQPFQFSKFDLEVYVTIRGTDYLFSCSVEVNHARLEAIPSDLKCSLNNFDYDTSEIEDAVLDRFQDFI